MVVGTRWTEAARLRFYRAVTLLIVSFQTLMDNYVAPKDAKRVDRFELKDERKL